MALSAQFNLAFRATLTGAADHGTPNAPVTVEKQIVLANGTGAAQADKIFSDQRTLNASTNEDLDLAGALTDPLGAALTFVKVKGIIVKAADANPADLIIGAAAVNGFFGLFGAATHTLNLPAGGVFSWVFPGTGKAVTAGTADLLRIASGAGGTSTYDITIIGTSA